MLFANTGSAPNNHQKQIHHTIGLSDPKTVIVYYNLKSVADFAGD